MRRPQASFEAQPRAARLLAPKMGIDPYKHGTISHWYIRFCRCIPPGGQRRPPLQGACVLASVGSRRDEARKSHHPRSLILQKAKTSGKAGDFGSVCRKSLAEFRRRSGEIDSNHFLRRRVRRRKYIAPCKLSETPRAQAPRSALGSVELMQSEASKWNLCARSAQIMRAAGRKPYQTETQRSGFRLKACQKHFFDTLSPGSAASGRCVISFAGRSG